MRKILFAAAVLLVACLLSASALAVPLAPELVLASNPTTGYLWSFVCSDEDVVAVMERQASEQPSEMVGAGTSQRFVFSGLRSGETSVSFVYGRPWEDAPIYRITCDVQVTDALDVQILRSLFDTY